jgi:hypothetical protein
MTKTDVHEFMNTKVRNAIRKIYKKEHKDISGLELQNCALTSHYGNMFLISARFTVYNPFGDVIGTESWIVGYDGHTVKYMIVDPKHEPMGLLGQLLAGGLQWDGTLKV